MAVVGRKLYALGGMLDGGYASLVEMYDAEEDNWIEVDPMSQARCNPGVAVAGGKIYVVGGLGENLLGPPGPLKTVEYYDVSTTLLFTKVLILKYYAFTKKHGHLVHQTIFFIA